MLRVLLEDFENSLAKILRIYHSEHENQLDDVEDADEDGWFDVFEEEGVEKEESCWPHECDKVESQSDIAVCKTGAKNNNTEKNPVPKAGPSGPWPLARLEILI